MEKTPATPGAQPERPGEALPGEPPTPAAPTEAEGHTVPTKVKTPTAEWTEFQALPPAEPPGEVAAGVKLPITTEDHTGIGDPAKETKAPASPTEAEDPIDPAEVKAPTTPEENENPPPLPRFPQPRGGVD